MRLEGNRCQSALNVKAQKLGKLAFVTFRASQYSVFFVKVAVIVSAEIILKNVRQLEVAKYALSKP